MRNQVFGTWDTVSYDTDGEFTLPAMNQDILNALPPTTPGRVILDLADVWHAEEIRQEIGYERVHMTLSNGTHLLIAKFGERGQKYAIAWHPQDQDAQKDALTALHLDGEVNEEDEDCVRLATLIQEIAQKQKDEMFI